MADRAAAEGLELKFGRIEGAYSGLYVAVVVDETGAWVRLMCIDDDGRRSGASALLDAAGWECLKATIGRVDEALAAKAGLFRLARR
jgi:hypothetical protein